MDREARQRERGKLAIIEEALSQARTALQRARDVTGDRWVRPGILELQVKVQALDLELLRAIDKLHD